MNTIADYINALKTQRDLLADILSEKGVTASRGEKFNTLIQKVNDIGSSGNLDIMIGRVERFVAGDVLSITSTIPTEITSTATEWIQSAYTIENN